MDGNMSWWKKLLGIKTPIEKKLDEIDRLQKLAFDAQRNGDLTLSGAYLLEVEALYDDIQELKANNSKE